MTTQLLFYRNPVPVSSEAHLETCVKAGDSYAFAANVNSVPLVASEFAEAGAEYPVVFAGEGEGVVPTVILGASGSQNAYVGSAGAWTGRYIPLFVRRYPFVFSHQTDAGRLVLHLDAAHEGVNTEGRGERLFDSDGGQTQYLRGILQFLEDYQMQFNRTRVFTRRLVEHDLLRPMEAQFTLPSGERRKLTGFKCVDREKMKALGTEVLETMFRTDELECTYLHLASLRHFSDLAERAMSTAPEETPNAADAAGSADFMLQ